MKNFNLKQFFAISLFSSALIASDYENDKFTNYVDGQGVNDVLEDAQFIICSLARFGTEFLVNDGNYKATIYSDECEAAAAATTSTQGTTAPSSANSSSSSSSSSAATNATANAKEIDTILINSIFKTSTNQESKAWIINDKIWDEDTNRSPKSITYLLNSQTEGVSDTNKFGSFTLKYQSGTFGNTQADLPEWYDCGDPSSNQYQYSWCADGNDLGRGVLIATGSSIKFKEEGQQGQGNLVADFYDNGDIAGIYSKRTGFQDDSLRDPNCDGAEDWWECQPQAYKDSSTEILGIFAFGITADSQSYCTKMTALYKVNWQQYDEATDGPTLTDYTLTGEPLQRLGSEGWDVNEKCFSIKKSDAIADIWDYGVYNSDGSKLALSNQSFPIRTQITVNDIDRRVHGYASYWGVHVDNEYQNYVTDTTDWVREDDNSETPATYNVKPRKLMIEKREKKFLALDELDGLDLNFWTNDSYWSDELQKLGFAAVEPWDGSIKFKTNKAVFTDYNNGSASDPLTYGIYGSHDGKSTYIANLVGATIDKDNIKKVIANDSSDPGKAMNLNVEFQDLPTWNGWSPQEYAVIFLCNKDFTYSKAFPTDFEDLTTDGLCLSIMGQLVLSSDGDEMTLSSKAGEGYTAMFKDYQTGVTLVMGYDEWNLDNEEYVLKITKNGFDRPSGMDLKIQQLFNSFGSRGQGDANGGDIQKGLNSFVDSSSSFTYMIGTWMNLYDHEGNRFNKVKGTFGISSDPTPTVFVDDIKAIEGTSSGATNDDKDYAFNVSLSKSLAADVTFDYSISNTSTSSTDDYSGLSNGTVTINAGSTSTTIPFKVIGDSLVEGLSDETIVLTLTNPSTNAVMGRTNAVAYIYDNDTNRVVYEDYTGNYNAATETFSVTHGMIFNPSYTKTQLPAPITFTLTDWLTNMQKVQGEGEEWEYIDYRDLNVWSPDTNSSYRIGRNSFLNPSSNSTTNGVVTEENTLISVAELPAKLNCLRECLTASGTLSHYGDVKTQADPAGDGTYTGSVSLASPNPFADVGPYLKTTQSIEITYEAGTENEWKETRDYTRGQWWDGIIADDVYTYTKNAGIVKDASGSDLKIGVEWGVSEVSNKIQGAYFNTVEGWDWQTSWGIGTGTLVDDTTLAKLECDYYTDSNGNKVYTEDHPEYTTSNGKKSKTRYCANKLWEDDILVSYNLRLETYKQYEIFNSDGTDVVFSPPKALYFTAPNTTEFGNDAGKKFRLEMHGSHLGGIPGSVIDINTGEDLGEYVETWKDNYRWIQRFTIPDGSILTENISDDTYLVKALRGQEWLGKKDSAIGTMDTLLTSRNYSDLLTNKDINFEIMNREVVMWDCSLTTTETGTDPEGNEFSYETTDWEACDALPYGSAERDAVWSISNSFTSCSTWLDWEYNNIQDSIDQQKADAAANGATYEGPNTPEEMGGDWLTWYERERARCIPIGDVPTDLINGGNPSVINGTVVFDPTEG